MAIGSRAEELPGSTKGPAGRVHPRDSLARPEQLQRAHGSDRSDTLFLVALAVVLTAFYSACGTYRGLPYKIESDGKYYYQYLVSVMQDGDLDFSDEYRVALKPWTGILVDNLEYWDDVDPRTGLPSNPFPFGSAILWAPVYLVVDGLAIVLGLPQDPWSRFYQYGVMIAALPYTLLAAWWMMELLLRWFAVDVRRTAVGVGVLATNILYYATIEPSMSHVYDLVTTMAVVTAFVRCLESEQTRAFVLFGVAGGLHTLVRPQNCVTVVILGVWLAFIRLRGKRAWRRRSILHLAAAAGLAAGISSLILVVNSVLRGSMWRMTHEWSFFDFRTTHVIDVLFSQRNGLFSHHPLLLIGVVGLCAALWTGRYLGPDRSSILLPLVLAFLAQVWINGATEDWWGGHAFGQRRLIGSYFPLVIGLAFVLQSWRDSAPRFYARGAAAVALAFVLMNVFLMYIHVYYWLYDEPHNIWDWMFRVASGQASPLLPSGT